MRLPLGSWSRRERAMLAVCGTSLALSVVAILGVGGAVSVAGQSDQVTSKEIANGTIRSVDIRKGSLRASDLGIYQRSGLYRYPGPPAGGLVYAQCDKGDRVLGGGHQWAGGHGFDTDSSIPYAGESWQFSGEAATPSSMLAYAICMKN